MNPRLLRSSALLLALVTFGATPPANKQQPTIATLDRGVHVFPVRAVKVNYARSHAGYPATDIFCPLGSQFVAPTGGIVHFVRRTDDWNPRVDDPGSRGGLAVAIIGDDGWQHYGSHLSAIASGIEAGVRVKPGDLLGLTGATGNARGRAPHLHYGISRPSAPDDWKTRRGLVDPYRHLKLWQQVGRDKAVGKQR